MKRKCVVCGKVYGESGDKQNGSVSGGICDKCMIAIEQYRYYKRMWKKTGFSEYEELMNTALEQLNKKQTATKKRSDFTAKPSLPTEEEAKQWNMLNPERG